MTDLSESPIKKRTSKLAIASLVFGLLSIFIQLIYLVEGLIPYFSVFQFDHWRLNPEFWYVLESIGYVIIAGSGILALVFGSIALYEIKNKNYLKGRCFAFWGTICGCEFIILLILGLIIVLFPPAYT
jgi:hypothetical protein